jgi:hypothetical protein
MLSKVIDAASERYTKMCFDAALELAQSHGAEEEEAELTEDEEQKIRKQPSET